MPPTQGAPGELPLLFTLGPQAYWYIVKWLPCYLNAPQPRREPPTFSNTGWNYYSIRETIIENSVLLILLKIQLDSWGKLPPTITPFWLSYCSSYSPKGTKGWTARAQHVILCSALQQPSNIHTILIHFHTAQFGWTQEFVWPTSQTGSHWQHHLK